MTVQDNILRVLMILQSFILLNKDEVQKFSQEITDSEIIFLQAR